ncbi:MULTISPECIES: hypothetical protein [unclassified Luteococcus]|uniref:hypothetical protein n=1 Tax=unclassified Luteococcus TaxID=2639923 RepID=UPI00313E0FB5
MSATVGRLPFHHTDPEFISLHDRKNTMNTYDNAKTVATTDERHPHSYALVNGSQLALLLGKVVMPSFGWVDRLLGATTDPAEMGVGAVLAVTASENDTGLTAEASADYLRKRCRRVGVSSASVVVAVQSLKASGWIEVAQEPDGTNATVYALTIPADAIAGEMAE